MNDDPDWYLRQWAKRAGKRQTDLVTDLGWAKATAHKLWHSKQGYSRKQINEVAAWLEIKPFELLMPPDDALALRRLRETAHEIVSGLKA